MSTKTLDISSTDYWFKVTDMGQLNWALIAPRDNGSVTIFFISDASHVFDRLSLPTFNDAAAALKRNGFSRYADDPDARDFILPPLPPYRESAHSNGAIYSSGRFWK